MTDQQLSVARAHVDEWTKTLGYAKPNMRFVAGMIEDLASAGIKGAQRPPVTGCSGPSSCRCSAREPSQPSRR